LADGGEREKRKSSGIFFRGFVGRDPGWWGESDQPALGGRRPIRRGRGAELQSHSLSWEGAPPREGAESGAGDTFAIRNDGNGGHASCMFRNAVVEC
jgi:hypothetical protein